jgi:putative transposase
MKEEGKEVSIRRICSVLDFPRSTFYYKPATSGKRKERDKRLEQLIYEIIQKEPTYGLRRIRAVAQRKTGKRINRKKIHRLIKLNSWQVRQRPKGGRPRVKGWAARATQSNILWQIDSTHVYTQKTGWCHLVAVIDCFDRSIPGWRFSSSGKAAVAAGVLEDALLTRRVRPDEENTLTLRSDNGLVFGSKEFTRVSRKYKLNQEYITPYTPEQNGMIERFFRSLKEECVWHYNFETENEAFRIISNWMDHYHQRRPHSALNYQTPSEFREKITA